MTSAAHSSKAAGDLPEVYVQPKKIEESVRSLRTLLTWDERGSVKRSPFSKMPSMKIAHRAASFSYHLARFVQARPWRDIL